MESSQQNSRPSLPAPEVQALEPFSGGAQLCSELPAHKTAVLHYAITRCKSCATTSNISIHFMQHIHSILKCSIPFPASPPSVTKQHVWPQHFLQVGLRLALQPGLCKSSQVRPDVTSNLKTPHIIRMSPLHLSCVCVYLRYLHLKHLTEVR